MEQQFQEEEENVVVLYYLALAALLLRKANVCKETLLLLHNVYAFNYMHQKFLLIDYYYSRIRILESSLLLLDKSK